MKTIHFYRNADNKIIVDCHGVTYEEITACLKIYERGIYWGIIFEIYPDGTIVETHEKPPVFTYE